MSGRTAGPMWEDVSGLVSFDIINILLMVLFSLAACRRGRQAMEIEW